MSPSGESAKPGARPPQVATAGWLIAVASVFAVIGGFDQIGSLNSVEVRDRLTTAGSDLRTAGLSVDDVITFLRIGAMVTAACAAATTVLGVFLVRGHRPARMPLTVLAVPLFVLGIVTGDVAGQLGVTLGAAVVAGAVTMLWSQPCRDWFAGRTPAPADRSAASMQPPSTPPAHRSRTPYPQQHPQQTSRPPTHQPSQPPYGQAPSAQQPHPQLGTGAVSKPTRRPQQVTWACVSTWYFCVLAMIGIGIALVPLLGDRAATVADVREQSLGDISQVPDQMIFAMAVLVYGGFALWAVAAMLVAVFVWRGREWARIVLLISSAVACVLLLGVSLGTLPALPVAIACAIVARLLLTPRTIAWCRGR